MEFHRDVKGMANENEDWWFYHEQDGGRVVHRWEHMGADLRIVEGEVAYTVDEFLGAAEPQAAKRKLREMLGLDDGNA